MSAEVVPMPLREDERAELVRLRTLEADMARPIVGFATELARLREVEHRARLLVDTIAERKARGWHKAPMREVEHLAESLEKK